MSTPPPPPLSIAIIGGGISGLCLAIGLLPTPHPITIYESASAFAEIGAGVSLGPNSQRAMSLIDPRIKAGFDRCVTNNAWEDRRDIWFSFNVGDEEWGAQGQSKGEGGVGAGGRRFADCKCETGQASVHRARFLDELIALVPEGVARFGKRLKGIDDNGDHVVLHFEDGTSARHSAVIGCDGVKSRTRQILLGENNAATNPQFTGKYAYRGLIPMDDAVSAIGEELARNSQMYLGHGGHILTFPIEHGTILNVVAFSTKADNKWDNEQWVLPMRRDDLFADFSGWIAPCQKLLQMMQKPDLWALFDHAPAPTYVKGRLCVIGDAAHASTPHCGAGAGMAIEDALVLSRLVGQCRSAEELERAFAVYDEVQRPRSQRLVTWSREGGLLYDMQLEGAGDDLEKMRALLAERLKWIWDVDLSARVEEASRLFGASKPSRL